MLRSIFKTLAKTIDWEKRLNNEMPFILSLIRNTGGKQICDLGGGTGRHSLYLQQKGYNVTLVDPDTESLEEAKKIGVEKVICASFSDFNKNVSGLDFILCIGNGLASLPQNEFPAFIQNCHRVLHKKGALFIQILNFDFIQSQEYFVISSKVYENILFLRFIEPFDKEKMIFHLVMTDLNSQETVIEKRNFNVYFADSISEMLLNNGFKKVNFYADFKGTPYNKDSGRDTIFCATK